MTGIQKHLSVVAASFILTSCVATQRTDLFFGTSIPGGGEVSEEQWKNFSDSIISVHFPEGYTVWNAQGRWLDKDTRRTIAEDTRVVTLIGKKGKARNAALDTIMHTYIMRFNQQAVLRVDSRTKATLISAE